jgi:hypothetical protein
MPNLAWAASLRLDFLRDTHFLFAWSAIKEVFSVVEHFSGSWLELNAWGPLLYAIIHWRISLHNSFVITRYYWSGVFASHCWNFLRFLLFSLFIYFSRSSCFLNLYDFLFINEPFSWRRHFYLLCLSKETIIISTPLQFIVCSSYFSFRFLLFLANLLKDRIKVILFFSIGSSWTIDLLNYI